MNYNRLIINYYMDNGVRKTLKLPFSKITSPNIINQVAISRYKKSTSYYSSITKSLKRSYNVTISGVIMDDMSRMDELINIISPVEFKTLNQYIDALQNLEPIINYSFHPRSGTIAITKISIDSIGITRNFTIEGIHL